MSFDWPDYLRIVDILAQTPTDTPLHEAAYRSAISRAYYAAFCETRNLLHNTREYLPKFNAEDHRDMVDWLQKSSESKKRLIGKNLGELREDRNSADYDNKLIGIAPKMAAKAVQFAKKILRMLSELPH